MKKTQLKKWQSNTLEFLYPALIVVGIALLGYITDVLPESAGWWAPIILYLVNVAKDYLKKRAK